VTLLVEYIAALERDRERLYWANENIGCLENLLAGRWHIETSIIPTECYSGETIREVIDAAMEAEAKDGEDE
jgi:hypothetical protein